MTNEPTVEGLSAQRSEENPTLPAAVWSCWRHWDRAIAITLLDWSLRFDLSQDRGLPVTRAVTQSNAKVLIRGSAANSDGGGELSSGSILPFPGLKPNKPVPSRGEGQM